MSGPNSGRGRVCHLTSVHAPFDVRIFHKECRTLAASGYEVFLVAPHDPHDKEEVVDGVHMVPVSRPGRRWQRMTRTVHEIYRRAVQLDADIYHFHDPELIPVGLALKALTRARVVYDIHEDYPRQILSKEWLPSRLRPWIALGMAGLERLTARLLDGLVAATPAIAQRLPFSRTVVVRNFPRLEEMVSTASSSPYAQRSPLVVYVGGIAAIRGAREMVEAMNRVEGPAELLLAGHFESEALQAQLSQLPGWQRTRFMGWLTREQVADLLGKTRIGLVLLAPLPRYQVALPVKLFEYMAAGIPFVASDFSLWREFGEGAGLFVDPQNPDQIARAIQWLLEHPAEAQVMGERGQQAVREHYNWDGEAAKLLGLYREMGVIPELHS